MRVLHRIHSFCAQFLIGGAQLGNRIIFLKGYFNFVIDHYLILPSLMEKVLFNVNSAPLSKRGKQDKENFK
jgi:hypothetical protein